MLAILRCELLGPLLAALGRESFLEFIQRRFERFGQEFLRGRWIVRIGLLGVFIPWLIRMGNNGGAFFGALVIATWGEIVTGALPDVVDRRSDTPAGVFDPLTRRVVNPPPPP